MLLDICRISEVRYNLWRQLTLKENEEGYGGSIQWSVDS